MGGTLQSGQSSQRICGEWTIQPNRSIWKGTGEGQRSGEGVQHAEAELRALMLAGLNGDTAAQHQFLTAISRPLRNFLSRRLVHIDPHYTEDLLQDILIAIHTRRATYDPAQPVTAWIYAIARYKLIDHFRRHRRRGVSVPIDNAADLFAQDQTPANDAARDLGMLLAHLPEKQRVAIKNVKLRDMSVREAAMQAGVSESDIKISIHRGLKKLAALISGKNSS
jgi:RNA polymerase sigma-70 factor (ECF subfamily)